MTGGASSGVQNRYSGIVESQEVWEISLSQDQQVKEILVSEGDTVQEGTAVVYLSDGGSETAAVPGKIRDGGKWGMKLGTTTARSNP